MHTLAIIGCFSIIYFFLNIFLFFYYGLRYLIGRRKDGFNFNDSGEWAVITGATDGIGKEYSLQLAERGMNICLISRNEEKLIKVASEIELMHKVETKTIVIDFCKETDSIYENIQTIVENLDIGVLVNNVGIGIELEYFHRFEKRNNFRKLLFCNIFSTVFLTHMVLPKMITKNKGVIINVGSSCCFLSDPFKTLYAASKAFMDSFSKSLEEECKPFNVHIQSLLPSYVSTNLTYNKKPCWNYPSAKKYVESAIKTIGLESRTYGYWAHFLDMLFFVLPNCMHYYLREDVFDKIIKYSNKRHNKKIMNEN